jgi:hypothetical protein
MAIGVGTAKPLELEFGASKERKYREEGQRDDMKDEPVCDPDHVADCGDRGLRYLRFRPRPPRAWYIEVLSGALPSRTASDAA